MKKYVIAIVIIGVVICVFFAYKSSQNHSPLLPLPKEESTSQEYKSSKDKETTEDENHLYKQGDIGELTEEERKLYEDYHPERNDEEVIIEGENY